MRLKTNLVISVVFVALVAFVYVHEIKGGQERDLAASRARQLIEFSDLEAQRLTIVHPDTTIVVQRGDDGWQIEEPVVTAADGEAVDRYLRSLKETEIEGDAVRDSAAVSADPGVLAPYGLDAPRLTVHLGLAASADTELDSLRFGNDTPTQRFTYAQRSGTNPEVRTVRAWKYDNLDKGLFDLRDRQVLHFDRDRVTRLRLHRAGATEETVIERVADAWRLTSPLAVAADAGVVAETLTRLGNARIGSFAVEAPAPTQFGAYGLGEGQAFMELSLTVSSEEGEASQRRLRLGRIQEKGNRYALDPSRKSIFVVDSTLVSQLTKSTTDFRDRRPFRLTTAAVNRIELAREGETVFQADRDSSGSWTLSSHPDRQAQSWRLNDLLTSLDGLEVEAFIADAEDPAGLDAAAFGFQTPTLRFRLDEAAGQTQTIELAETEGLLLARRPDIPSIYTVDPSALADLAVGLEDVALTATAPDTATGDAGQ